MNSNEDDNNKNLIIEKVLNKYLYKNRVIIMPIKNISTSAKTAFS